METETIDKLYLELSQFTKAKTKRELELEELVRSACAIAERQGQDTQWVRFIDSAAKAGLAARSKRAKRKP